jgi:hypothetical protein
MSGQAGTVVVQVAAADFERLWENSSDGSVTDQAGRFEVVEASEARWSGWKRAYWLGDNYAAVIFARAFLAARGFDYEVLYDTASDREGGPMFGYVIVTDYEEER